MLASDSGAQAIGYNLQTYPWCGLFSADGKSPFTDGIRDCEIAYGDVVEIRLPLEALGYPETVTFDWINVGLDWTGFETIGSYQLKLPARIPIATITKQPSPAATVVVPSDETSSPASVERDGGSSFLPVWLLLGAGGLLLMLVLFWVLRRRRNQ